MKKKAKTIFIYIGVILFAFIFIRNYINVKKDFQKSYGFLISKIDTVDNKNLKFNDHYFSPNFVFPVGMKINIGDSISKKANSEYLYIYNSNQTLTDSIKKTSLYPPFLLKQQ